MSLGEGRVGGMDLHDLLYTQVHAGAEPRGTTLPEGTQGHQVMARHQPDAADTFGGEATAGTAEGDQGDGLPKVPELQLRLVAETGAAGRGEGVEPAAHAQLLREAGFRVGQGQLRADLNPQAQVFDRTRVPLEVGPHEGRHRPLAVEPTLGRPVEPDASIRARRLPVHALEAEVVAEPGSAIHWVFGGLPCEVLRGGQGDDRLGPFQTVVVGRAVQVVAVDEAVTVVVDAVSAVADDGDDHCGAGGRRGVLRLSRVDVE